ncbi:CFI-box-CTERM domain-containing protein [Bdellovibrio sp. HCB337]|uniref:CFI-box-CTERM domain-containing protein n=1 Tax=Bdellovibrio sp. HCB337 TaxID=3394358 RepID=UPI0039A53071
MKLQSAGETVPGQVCVGCINELQRSAANSSGGVLMAQERAKEQHRLQLWKNRVQLIKQARTCMNQKMYSEAAGAYEKYLKIMEIVFDCKKNELKPELFKESARHTELTVVASVYWDLLRIYDMNDRYNERQNHCAKQLANFIRFTPIYPDIIRKAEVFQRSAKNPAVIKQFLKMSSASRPRCFVATAAFESVYAVEVQQLRFFRDHSLKKHALGRHFTLWYYRVSPKIACLLDKHSWAKPAVRALLRVLIKCVS